MANLIVKGGLLTVEGGVSMSGVTLDMVTNLRETYATLKSLVLSLEGTEALNIPEIEAEYHKAQALIKYITTLYMEEKKTWKTTQSQTTETKTR
jgi:hypothetical protein